MVPKSNLTVTVEELDHKPVSTEDKKNTDRLVAGFVSERR